MGITEERIKRITEQAAAMKAIGKASVDVSGDLEALASDNAAMEAEIQGLEEANARLRELADRIDREMVELPKDAGGVPINVGDTVYRDGGCMAKVSCFSYMDGATPFVYLAGGRGVAYLPTQLTHACPDSWEKLEEDAKKTVCDFALAPRGEDGYATCDGCRFYESKSCNQEMKLEILKRAKKLAGIEELEGGER